MGIRRLRAVVGLKSKESPGLLVKSKTMYTGLASHADIFTDPNPPLPIFLGKITSFGDAQQFAGTRTRGAAAARDAKALEFITVVELELAYIQFISDQNPEKSQAVIEAAGLLVANGHGFTKPLLRAKQDVPSGPVRLYFHVGMLTAGAEGKIFFECQLTSDGGATWISMPPTLYAHMDFEGLLPKLTYGFRVRFADLKGSHEWSPILSYLVR
jgi:hypothetical protein